MFAGTAPKLVRLVVTDKDLEYGVRDHFSHAR